MHSDTFDLKALIRPVVDFPKPGVIFRDITPLFQSPRGLRYVACLLYTSPSPRDLSTSRMPSSA